MNKMDGDIKITIFDNKTDDCIYIVKDRETDVVVNIDTRCIDISLERLFVVIRNNIKYLKE